MAFIVNYLSTGLKLGTISIGHPQNPKKETEASKKSNAQKNVESVFAASKPSNAAATTGKDMNTAKAVKHPSSSPPPAPCSNSHIDTNDFFDDDHEEMIREQNIEDYESRYGTRLTLQKMNKNPQYFYDQKSDNNPDDQKQKK